MALLTMGGALKRREMISARFADILLRPVSPLRRAQALAGRRPAGRGFPAGRIFDAGRAFPPSRRGSTNSYANLPLRPVAWLLRFMVLPLGPRHRGVDDQVMRACADLLMEPSATRDRLTSGIYHPQRWQGSGADSTPRSSSSLRRNRSTTACAKPGYGRSRRRWRPGSSRRPRQINLQPLSKAVLDAVNVDDFSVEELTGSTIVNAHVGDKSVDGKSAVNQAAE